MRMNAVNQWTSPSQQETVSTAVHPFAYPHIQYKKLLLPTKYIHSPQHRKETTQNLIQLQHPDPGPGSLSDVSSCQPSPDIVEPGAISQYPLGKGGGGI